MLPTEKPRVPEEIEAKMKLWRLGETCLPQEYIDFHRDLALAAKPQLEADYKIHSEQLVSDGWLDGMQFIELIIEHRLTGDVHKIKWSDSFLWYRHCPGGGWIIFHPDYWSRK